MTNEPELRFIAALKAFLSIPYSPRKAFTTIVTHRSLEQALILMVASAFLSAIAELLLVGRVLKPMTILYVIHVQYSDIAWIMNESSSRLAGFLGMILFAFLVIDTVPKSGEPPSRYFSAVGYFIPWSLSITVTLLAAWHYIWDADLGWSSILIYWALLLPASIWLLWLVGTAISVAGEVRVSIGILAGLAAVFYWSIAATVLGWPIALAIPVIWFAWKAHLRRTV